MQYSVLASDYDGTLAEQGSLKGNTISALREWKKKKGKLVLVTGRALEDLLTVCNVVYLFDGVVAENGAIFYSPASDELITLGARPPAPFLQTLKDEGVSPIEVGRVIVATHVIYRRIIEAAIRKFQLSLHTIINNESLMILPVNIDKGVGLNIAFEKMGLLFRDTIGVGDAENDISFLKQCAFPVAVANAIPEVLRMASFVTQGSAGDGIVEIIKKLES